MPGKMQPAQLEASRSEILGIVSQTFRPAQDAVEHAGFGYAQYRTLLLAHGIWFVEGVHVLLAVVCDARMSMQFGFSYAERASLTSLIFFGILVGSLSSGFISDSWGRRMPLLAGYLLAGVAQLLVPLSSTYGQVMILRFFIGLASGLGMPSSCALVNESSPAAHRNYLMGLRNFFFAFGALACAILVVVDSPSLEHLHWRTHTYIAAAWPLLWGSLAFALLHESPMFLANVGRHAEARETIRMLRRLNGYDEAPSETSIAEGFPHPAGGTAKPGGAKGRSVMCMFTDSLSMVLGRHSQLPMLALIVGTMTMNMLVFGHGYAFPKIAGTIDHDIIAGYQTLMQQIVGVLCAACVLVAISAMSCRTTLIVAGLAGQFGITVFIQAASMDNRPYLLELAYLVAQSTPTFAATLGLSACYQLSMDLFDVRARATSAAICMAAGRVAAILSPLLFEVLPTWQSFYTIMVLLCTLTVLMAGLYLPTGASKELEPLLNIKGALKAMP